MGEAKEGERVCATPFNEVFDDDEDDAENAVAHEEPRIREWWKEVLPIVESPWQVTAHRVARRLGR